MSPWGVSCFALSLSFKSAEKTCNAIIRAALTGLISSYEFGHSWNFVSIKMSQ